MSAPVTIGGCTLWHGDCRTVLRGMAEASVDSVVTDPPYHLGEVPHVKRGGWGGPRDEERKAARSGFMGKKWDGGDIAFRPETWAEVLRVMKPGAHLVAFGGTRTYHRLACAIEDAGFEVRDTICWHYGSGFPKSLDVSKQLDKMSRRDFVVAAVELGLPVPGNSLHDWTKGEHSPSDEWWRRFKSVLSPEQWQAIERRVVGKGESGRTAIWNAGGGMGDFDLTAPATDAARRWQGWGTALKPATELIVLARKPLAEPTVAAQVLATGTGALNIDATRIPMGDEYDPAKQQRQQSGRVTWKEGEASGLRSDHEQPTYNAAGRWPANLCHDGSPEVLEAFAAYGTSKDGVAGKRSGTSRIAAVGLGALDEPWGGYGGEGSPARFFFSAKADAEDRAGSKHPTVKPVALLRWLVRLVTPKGGLVLDPFAGTGTTGEAALREGFRAVLVEREAEYHQDALRRLGRLSGADCPLFAGAAA